MFEYFFFGIILGVNWIKVPEFIRLNEDTYNLHILKNKTEHTKKCEKNSNDYCLKWIFNTHKKNV